MVVGATRALLLMVVAAFLTGTPASASEPESCDPATDVVVTVDPGPLDGDVTTRCVPDAAGRTALDVLDATGVSTESTTGGMPMLCRVDGRPAPEDETCGANLSGDGYWAFYLATIDSEWGYAQVGPADYEVSSGEFVTFEYTPLSQTNPVMPELSTSESSFTSSAIASAGADDEATQAGDEESDDDGGWSWPFGVGILVLVVVIAGAVLIARRRRDEP